MHVRLARASDAESIRSIYNAEVTGSTATFDLVPRTPEEQQAWLAGPPRALPGGGGHRRPGRPVLGFGSLSEYKNRPSYATTVENSVYVDAAHRGEGVGKALLEHLVDLATQHGFHSVIARVGGDNLASTALHQACGFTLVGVEREVGRKFNRWLDVTVLQRLL